MMSIINFRQEALPRVSSGYQQGQLTFAVRYSDAEMVDELLCRQQPKVTDSPTDSGW